MNPDKPTPQGEVQPANHDPLQHGKAESHEDLAAAPDHDVPNEVVIEKTLPEPHPDKQE